jgi:hypothetical protein
MTTGIFIVTFAGFVAMIALAKVNRETFLRAWVIAPNRFVLVCGTIAGACLLAGVYTGILFALYQVLCAVGVL